MHCSLPPAAAVEGWSEAKRSAGHSEGREDGSGGDEGQGHVLYSR